MTGSELHEPKGANTAGLGTVYVADGAGSGSWNSIGTSAFTGMIADFAAPVAPAGWLELDGSVISTSTYSGLFAVMSITTSGTRTNGSPIVTSIPSTTTYKSGYYVFGTGINSGTTIVTVDSPTQITLSANAVSSGTSSFFVSPWPMGTGTITLPDLTTAGRYRRSRTSSTKVGDVQADIYKTHTHDVTGTSGVDSVDHTHNYSGTTSNDSPDHTHNTTVVGVINGGGVGIGSGGSFFTPSNQNYTSAGANSRHTHTFAGTSSGISSNHTHSFAATSTASGSTETRPITLVVLTCIKT